MTQRRDNKLAQQIFDKFRTIRKARGLTQSAVYEDTGVDVKTYESRSVNPSIATIAILCSYFEITLEDFFKDISISDDLNQWN
jgi:transcriptional regulator with XRE-family HTH domain